MLGEVFSAYYALTIPSLALGSLVFGWLANFLNWRIFVLVFALASIFITLFYVSNRKLRTYSLD